MKSQRRPCERRDPYSAAFAVGKDRQRRPHKNNCGRWLWVPAFAGTTEGFRTQFSKSRRMGTQLRSRGASRPKFYMNLPSSNQEGAGKTGCALHPRSRVQLCTEEHAHEHTGSAGASRPSLRNGFTAYFVLSPVNGSFATVAPAEACFSQNLTPAPRRQDHTTSPYARATLVSRSSRVHRISPRVRDDGQRPSSAVRRAELCH